MNENGLTDMPDLSAANALFGDFFHSFGKVLARLGGSLQLQQGRLS